MANDSGAKKQFLLKSVFLSVARAAVGMPYEHPLDTIKTVMQSQQRQDPSLRDVIKQIYAKEGIKGFYAGFIPNFARVVLKTVYRIPMMLELPHLLTDFSKRILNHDLSSTTAKSLAGVVIAAFEVVIVTPAERLKVLLMTKQAANKNIRYFFRHSYRLFRGLELVFLKQAVSWITFLGTDELMKQFIRKTRKLSNTQMLSFFQLFALSVVVGLVNTTCTMPLDFLKTRIQKDGSIDSHKGLELVRLAKDIYKEHGIKMFYSGWRVRMTQYIIQSMLTVKLYDMLQTGYRKVVSPT